MALVIDKSAFTIGALDVRWYGIILALGALAGLFLAIREGKRFGIIPDFFMDVLLIGVPSALVGARIYYVAFQWEDYRGNILDVFKIWEGGIAIYGALIGAFIGTFFYIRAKGYSFWRIADICAPGLLIGQLIGRWGNFMNQEAHGGPVTEAFLRTTLHLPNFIVNQMFINGEFYHPTFLYESLWNLLGLLIIFWLRRRPLFHSGQVILSYLVWYSIGRFFIEGLRTDSLAFAGPHWLASAMNAMWSPMTIVFDQGAMELGKNIRSSQIVAILLILVAIGLIIFRHVKGYSRERYSDPIISTKAIPADLASAEVTQTEVAEGLSVENAQPTDVDAVEVGEPNEMIVPPGLIDTEEPNKNK
ncbi:MAG: prolipoprotein diacylglyceryl transferase [Gorillibacterium sp.]|nr:prolipoprotein diacylglyceryl transferase [Gorillibacterium sp.]